jgi:hypothetical protein
MNVRRAHLALVCGLIGAGLVAAGSGTAIATAQGKHAGIGRIVFRLKDNVVICGVGRPDSKALICFRPDNGATARLTPRGRPTAKLVSNNRGIPARALRAPLLRKGQVVHPGVYRCSLKKTDVRCSNPTQHGFQMGKVAIFRY